MKMLYISELDKTKDIGWYRKILSQCSVFEKELKCTIFICVKNHDAIELLEYRNMDASVVNSVAVKYKNIKLPFIKKFSAFINYNLYLSAVDSIIKNSNPQFIYIRRLPHVTLKLIRILKKYSDKYLAYEYPTFPFLAERINRKAFFDLALEIILNSQMEKHIDIFPVVLSKNIDVKKQYLPFENGINNVINIKSKKIKNTLNLLGLAHVEYWHGYDRIIEGISEYKKTKGNLFNVVFHIMGDGSEIPKLKALVDRYQLADNVLFYGNVKLAEYTGVLQLIDIAIGGIAWHRKNMDQAAELKLREYTAMGIPFITSIHDNCFAKYKYKIAVPADDSAVDIASIITKNQKFLKNKTMKKEIVAFAREKLLWGKTFLPVVKRIEKEMNAIF